jgi:hypothetical protein
MFNRRIFMALAALLVLSAPSFAGGGGAKKDATISVRNDQSVPIAVFVGQDAVTKAAALPPFPTQAQIEAAGGVIVNAGQVLATKVVAGTIPVAASNSDGPAGSMSVTIGKGQTKKYAFTNANIFVAY